MGKRINTYIHQAKARHDFLLLLALDHGRPIRRKGTSHAPRVDEEFVHVLEAFEAMGAAPAQHIDVQLVGLGEQQVGLVAHQREALQEADPYAAVGDHLGQR